MAENEIKRLPPYSIEAEQSVIGSILIDEEAVLKVLEILRPEDFYRPEHEEIMRAVFDLTAENTPIDIVSVTDKLRSTNKLDFVGGPTYIMQLASSVPNAANVEYYAKIVKTKALLRELIKAGAEISELGFNESMDIDEVLNAAEQKIFNISQRKTQSYFLRVRDFLHEHFTEIENRHKRKLGLSGIPSGFPSLDKITGGFQKSDLVIIAARPSIGKTSLALNITEHIAIKEQKPVGFFSLEMSKEQLIERMLCAEAKVDMMRLKTGYLRDEDWPKLTEAYSSLYEAPIYIDDSPDVTLNDIRTKSRRLAIEAKIEIIFIDYLQLIRSEQKVENRVLEISQITRGLKNLARELDIPIVVLSQLSRAVEKREDKRPVLSDLRESGSIEQDADVVIFLHVPDEDNREEIELIVAKQRNGPQGKASLLFQQEYTKFVERVEGY
jgi:replicative DNA helicase